MLKVVIACLFNGVARTARSHAAAIWQHRKGPITVAQSVACRYVPPPPPWLTITQLWCESGLADAPPDPQYLLKTASCVVVSAVLLPTHAHLCAAGEVYPVVPCRSRRPIHIWDCVVFTPQNDPTTYAASAAVANVASFPPFVHCADDVVQANELAPSAL